MNDDATTDHKAEREAPLSRVEFWMRIAGFSFALWAMALPVAITMLRSSAEKFEAAQQQSAQRMADYMASSTAALATYTLQTERRLVIIEERLAQNSARLAELARDLQARGK